MRHLHFLYCKQNETAGAVRMKEKTAVNAGTGFFCTGSDGVETAEAQSKAGGESETEDLGDRKPS